MRTPLIASWLAVASLASLGAGQAPPAVATRLSLDVVAVNRSGVPVTDLAPGEFEVWISGYRVPVDEVAFMTPQTSPRTVAVILDNVAVTLELVPRVRDAAKALVQGMADSDRFSVMTLLGMRTDSVGEPARLLQAIDAFRPQSFPFRVDDAGQHVLQRLTTVARQMIEAPGRRKAIVAVGAAWLFDTPLPPPGMADLHDEWLTTMRTMAAANASLYVIDPVGLRPARGFSHGGDSGLARETGGYAFVDTNDVAGAAARILNETGTYYVLRMADPPVQRTADLREVRVRVLREGVTVRARRGIPGKR